MGRRVVVKINSYYYKNIESCRAVPILFIVVCFLIIANISCDQVGSTNEDDKMTTDSTATTKYDPLSMLREIYLDSNSKIITMIGDKVQKFHPNGRYGRRSVDNIVEPHSEYARLRAENPGLKLLLRDFEPRTFETETKFVNSDIASADGLSSRSIDERTTRANLFARSLKRADSAGTVELNQSELNKLLKCNYSGVSNLYWCDTGN